ncbi:MAG: HTH domain-containing protein [Myxococcota bacterium]
MDSAINTAARALAAGDPIAALNQVGLREDGPGLALRGIAMAQLGEWPRAKELLRAAARKLDREPLARARCIAAQTEVALAMRELGTSAAALDEAIEVLDARHDRINATHARLLRLRRLLLLGRLDEAEAEREVLDLRAMPPMLQAYAQLVTADIAVRRVRARAAAMALRFARHAAALAGIGALRAEIEATAEHLRRPAARLRSRGRDRTLGLVEVEEILDSPALVVDACRRTVGRHRQTRSLARRPVLFGLVTALAEAWPGDVGREQLLAEVFEAEATNESWRARLRVEIGRLRKQLGDLATVESTPRGFGLRSFDASEVVLLVPPVDGEHAAVLALLSDGSTWSTSALSLALGVSQRTVQRALAALQRDGRVQALGRARALRWVAPPVSGYTTALLLPRLSAGG